MKVFSLKEILAQARKAEGQGHSREASAKYASIGVYLRKNNKLKDAVLFHKKAIQLSKTSPRLYIQLSLCHWDMGEEENALKVMERFTRYALRKTDLKVYRDYMEEHLSKHPRLRVVFYKGLLDLDRTDAEPFLAYAKALSEMNELGLAKKYLLKALGTNTRMEEVTKALKELLTRMGVNDEYRIVEKYEGNEMSLADLVVLLTEPVREEGDGDVNVKTPLADSVEQLGKEHNLQGLIKKLEGELGFPVEDMHENIVPLVKEFRERSDKVIGNHSKTRIDMAQAFFEMELKSDARDEILRIGEADPYYLEAQMLLAEILISEGSFLAALEVTQRCIRDSRATNEILYEAKYKLVYVYQHLGDLRKALKTAYELEEENGGYRDIKDLRIQLQNSMVKYLEGQAEFPGLKGKY